VSYRRGDAAGHAGRLYDTLLHRFALGEVFRDIDSIEPGADFPAAIADTIAKCQALIAVIGSDWASVTDEDGHRRLDDPHDFVRLEIQAALERKVPVFPVLVNRAPMPRVTELPTPLRQLRKLNAIEISDERWAYDSGRLIEALEVALGLRLRTAAPGVAAEPVASPRRHRHHAAVLFASVSGLEELAEILSADDFHREMNELYDELMALLRKRFSTPRRSADAGIMAVFGVPQTREEDPENAVDAAIAMNLIIQRRSGDLPSPLSLHVGISAGPVVSLPGGAEAEFEIVGETTEDAARFREAAGAGEILMSRSVWRHVRNRYEADVRELDRPGRHEQVQAFRIVGHRLAPLLPETAPLVGRSDELALIELLWSTTVKGEAHVIRLVGEAGVGKSRLLLEFPRREDALDIRIRCGFPRAFGPFLDLAKQILGRLPEDQDDLIHLSADLPGLEEAVPLLGPLFGFAGSPPTVAMADDHQIRQVFAGFWLLLMAALRSRPGLLVLDDLQWADESSLDLLRFILERLRGMPLLLVLAYRPEFSAVDRMHARASDTFLRLEPLDPRESLELARGLLGAAEIPAELETLLATRAEGNPFFLEELIQVLVELGSIVIDEGSVSVAKTDVHVPETIQGTILARADLLSDAARAVLEQAAVIGRRFSSDLLESLGDVDEHLRQPLDELEGAQMLVPDGPDGWSFKHALIQEVIYSSLYLHQRRELHRKVAEALEVNAAPDGSTLEILAEHFGLAAVPEKARSYAMAAGDFVSERLGFAEAKIRYQVALRLWGEGDLQGRLGLLMKLGHTAMLGGDAPAAKAAFIEAETGWRGTGNNRQAGAALATLGRVYLLTGETDQAIEVLKTATELLEPEGPSEELLRAFSWSSTLDLLAGRIDEALTGARSGLEIAEQLNQPVARSHLTTTLTSCEINRGDATALDRLRRGIGEAEACGEVEAIGRAYINAAANMQWVGENEEATSYTRQGRERMRRVGASYLESLLQGIEAEALVDLGRYEQAEDAGREILGPLRPWASVPSLAKSGGAVATALLRRGRFDEARLVLNDALPLARGLGGMEFLARMLSIEAEMDDALSNPASAQSAAGEAVRVVLGTTSYGHWYWVLGKIARLLPRASIVSAIGLLSGISRNHPRFEAGMIELDAILHQDVARFSDAAMRYGALGLPYEQARCLLDSGELEHAETIVARLAIERGPLGRRLLGLRDAGSSRGA
jgi:class 3 adenylate cyclase/tetratricopeptide (TPR) repeat protein